MQVHRFCCILNLLVNPPSLLSGVYGFIVPHALSTIYPEIGAWTILTLTASTCVTWVAAVMTWVTDTECLCFLTEHTAQAVINEEIWVSSLSPCMKTGETSVYSCGNMSVFWSIMCWFRVFSDTFQSHKCGGNWGKTRCGDVPGTTPTQHSSESPLTENEFTCKTISPVWKIP